MATCIALLTRWNLQKAPTCTRLPVTLPGLRWLPGTEPLPRGRTRGSWCPGSEPWPLSGDGCWWMNASWWESLRGIHQSYGRTPAGELQLPPGSPAHSTPFVGFPPPLPYHASWNHLPYKLPCSESALGQTQPGTDDENLGLTTHSVNAVYSTLTFPFTDSDLFKSTAAAPAEPAVAHQHYPGAGVGQWPGPGDRRREKEGSRATSPKVLTAGRATWKPAG